MFTTTLMPRSRGRGSVSFLCGGRTYSPAAFEDLLRSKEAAARSLLARLQRQGAPARRLAEARRAVLTSEQAWRDYRRTMSEQPAAPPPGGLLGALTRLLAPPASGPSVAQRRRSLAAKVPGARPAVLRGQLRRKLQRAGVRTPR